MWLRLSLIFCSALIAPQVISDVADNQRHEVNYLIEFIKQAGCKLERNGTLYAGAEAIKHIQRKYDYYRDDIKTTEDFIRYAASKSEMTGRPYLAHCGSEKAITGEEWLLQELQNYRARREPQS